MAAAFGVPPTTGAARPDPGWFHTPSGNIHCFYAGDASGPEIRGVTCGLKSGFKPPPARRGPSCSVPDRVGLTATGRARLSRSICPGEDEGDAGPFAAVGSWVLGYGRTWSGGGVRCSSAMGGLTCRNRSGHGFFLSRARSRLF